MKGEKKPKQEKPKSIDKRFTRNIILSKLSMNSQNISSVYLNTLYRLQAADHYSNQVDE